METTGVFNVKHVLACLPGEGPKSYDRKAYINEKHYYSLSFEIWWQNSQWGNSQ